MHCENCGARITEGASYCAGCGTPVPGSAQPPSEEGGTWRERLSGIIGGSRKERMLAAGTLMAAIVAIVAFALLDTPDDAPPQDAFTREADAQCVEAKQRVAAAGAEAATDSKPGAQSRYAAAILNAVTEWKLAFDSLEPTPGFIEQAQELDDALLTVTVELGALSRLSRVGSQAEISAQAAATDEATVALEAAISDLGLADCPTTSLDTAPRPG